MVQTPRVAVCLTTGSFAVGAATGAALRGEAAVVARVELLSARADGLLLGVAVAEEALTLVALLDERGAGGDAATVGDPDDRTVGAAVLGVDTVAGAGPPAVTVGHRAP